MVVNILVTVLPFLLTSVVAGVLTNMISTDVEARSHGWAEALIRRAVKALPSPLQDRYAEEWAADLLEQPSPLSKLFFATGLLGAARRIRIAERRRVAFTSFGLADRIKKRSLDLCIAVPAVILITPILLIVAVIIKIESPGPVFFRQTKVGCGNRLFRMLKFRSAHLYNGASPHQAPHITRLGRFLRVTSIDELPQLFNVVTGNMTIVGPRPRGPLIMIEGVSQTIKPGLTGIAAIGRDANVTPCEPGNPRSRESEYIRGWNIWRDIKLIAATFGIVFRKNS